MRSKNEVRSSKKSTIPNGKAYDYQKVVTTNERATSMELMIGLNGYAVGSGLLDASLNTTDFNVIKLKEEDILTLGYIVR